MIKVNILTQGFRSTNGVGFLYPIVFNKLRFQNIGLDIQIHTKKSDALYDCDIFISDSKIYRDDWANNSEMIFNDFRKYKEKIKKVIFYDIGDSSGGLIDKIIPYVDLYIKSFTYKNKQLYKNEFYNNRIWTDYYHREFNINDDSINVSKNNLSDSDIQKIRTGHNQGLVDCSLNGKFIVGRYYNELMRKYLYFNKLSYCNDDAFVVPSVNRNLDLSCRIGIGYNRNTVSYQRKQVSLKLSEYIQTNKLKRKEYFDELKKSKVVISPFGWGELNTPRDYEVAINGALLLKPDVSHIDTYPNIFTDEYIETFKWDLSDLEMKIEDITSRYENYIEKAIKYQNIYKYHISTEDGYYDFCDYFKNIILND